MPESPTRNNKDALYDCDDERDVGSVYEYWLLLRRDHCEASVGIWGRERDTVISSMKVY